MMIDDNDGQMKFGDLGGLKLPDICLTGEGKIPQKNLAQETSRPGIEPGPAAWQARMSGIEHGTSWTAVRRANNYTKETIVHMGSKFYRLFHI